MNTFSISPLFQNSISNSLDYANRQQESCTRDNFSNGLQCRSEAGAEGSVAPSPKKC